MREERERLRGREGGREGGRKDRKEVGRREEGDMSWINGDCGTQQLILEDFIHTVHSRVPPATHSLVSQSPPKIKDNHQVISQLMYTELNEFQFKSPPPSFPTSLL